MVQENKLREMIHLAQLELLGIAKLTNKIHTNLLMRHFAQARVNLIALLYQIGKVRKLIPDEPGE